MVRYVSDEQGENQTRLAVDTRGPATAYLTRALIPHTAGRLPLRAERELRTLAEALGGLVAGRVQAVEDLLAQRFRAVEASVSEDGGWAVAQHFEAIPSLAGSSCF